MTREPDSRIYFLKPIGMDGPIKIGCSRCPEGRVMEVARVSPFPLEMMASGEGPFTLERTLHRRFKHARLHLEWFRPDPALVAGIERVKAGEPVHVAFGYEIRTRLVGRKFKYESISYQPLTAEQLFIANEVLRSAAHSDRSAA